MVSCLDCCFFLGIGGSLRQEPSVSLLLNYESAVIQATAEEVSLLRVASSSTDCRLPRGFWCDRTRTSACSLVAAPTTDFNMAPIGSTVHRHQHGLWWEHRPQGCRLGLQWQRGPHGGLSKGLNPENELFFISNILCCSESG